MKKLIYLSLIFFCQHAFALVTTQLDTTQVVIGNLFHISFTVNANISDIQPNFAPLQQNFQIVGTRKSTQIAIINGNSSITTIWELTLAAKHVGTFTIPALTFNSERSNPIKLQVSATAAANNAQANPQPEKIFLETSVDKQQPYIQSQILYTVKLYYTQRLTNGAISAPHAAQAVILPLDKGQQSQEKKDGILYQIWQQHYAIFPQQRGQLTIKPPVFNGGTIDPHTQDFDHLLFAPQRPLQVSGRPITLDVEPIPAGFADNQWLPAQQITLIESWQGMNNTLQIGQPLTREIVIRAEGLTAAQLPEFPTSNIAGVNTYPGQAKTNNTKHSNTIISEKHITLTYIPTQTGTFTLPAISLPWWNTKTNSREVARLPQHVLTIFPVGNITTPATNTTVNRSVATIATPTTAPTVNKPQWSWFLVAIGFMGLWLLTLLWWGLSRYYKKAKLARMMRASNVDENSNQDWRQQLQYACYENQAKLAQYALLNLARTHWPQHKINNVSDIIKLCDDHQIKIVMNQLNAAIYAQSPSSWDGKPLWQLWQTIEKQKTGNSARTTPLPPLYPEK